MEKLYLSVKTINEILANLQIQPYINVVNLINSIQAELQQNAILNATVKPEVKENG